MPKQNPARVCLDAILKQLKDAQTNVSNIVAFISADIVLKSDKIFLSSLNALSKKNAANDDWAVARQGWYVIVRFGSTDFKEDVIELLNKNKIEYSKAGDLLLWVFPKNAPKQRKELPRK